ncbi:glycosyltransferase [Parabacteroides sp. PF5-6]|uniref:glycosyltransferase n=1 Tax=Parabacteroides sp. PF5-6 TaxID=1742403 RepID=UPI002404F13F|nr:glycosyltransferase [Parabacteroides sp. PF5-6]MDF9830302.1 glycosyltransferase involved in cell wall biosynthesis [Parabacteroides sp. PF5-6]
MENLFVFTPLEIILLIATGFFFLIQLLYWLVTYARPLRKLKKIRASEPEQWQAISVVVYAKNESENLRKHLPALLTQDYPEYEVVVVNDGSTDESDEVLKTLEQEYPHLYHTYIPEDVKYLSRKKLALTVGIKAAKHKYILFTEANCEPLTNRWIHSIAKAYRPDTEIVLGFCAYRYNRGLKHQLIAYDNLLDGLQYLSSALKRHPFTGNGRNLSYRKELFFEHKGYQKSLGLHAGDDDLFINESANRENTKVTYTPDSITQMSKIERFRVWREMKVSRAATQRYYKGTALTYYRLEPVTHLLLLLATVATIVVSLSGNWLAGVIAGVLLLLRYLTKAVILHKSAKMLQQKPTTVWLFLLEIIKPIFSLYTRIYRLFRGKNDYTFRLS